MCVGESIESVRFVETSLNLSLHVVLSNSLLDVLSVFELHVHLFVVCNFLKLFKLLSCQSILVPFFVKLVHTIFCFLQRSGFRLLLILLHVTFGLFISSIVEKQSAFSFIDFLSQKVFKRHLGKKFVIL